MVLSQDRLCYGIALFSLSWISNGAEDVRSLGGEAVKGSSKADVIRDGEYDRSQRWNDLSVQSQHRIAMQEMGTSFPPEQLHGSWLEVRHESIRKNAAILIQHLSKLKQFQAVRKAIVNTDNAGDARIDGDSGADEPDSSTSSPDQTIMSPDPNYLLDRIIPPLMGFVLKINAYSVGVSVAAKALENLADFLMVESAEDAIKLRLHHQIKTPILILYRAYTSPNLLCRLAKLQIRVSALSVPWLMSVGPSLVQLCPDVIRNYGKLKVHVMVDTGLGREGLRIEEAVMSLPVAFGTSFIEHPSLDWEGLYTHFCCPYDPEAARYTGRIWKQTLDILKAQGVLYYGENVDHGQVDEKSNHRVIRHAVSSANVFRLDLMDDMVRVGGLVFGTELDLTLHELDFWQYLEWEMLGTTTMIEKQAKATRKVRDAIRKSPNTNSQEGVPDGNSNENIDLAKYSGLTKRDLKLVQDRLIAVYGQKYNLFPNLHQLNGEGEPIQKDFLFVINSDRFFSLLNVEDWEPQIRTEREGSVGSGESTGSDESSDSGGSIQKPDEVATAEAATRRKTDYVHEMDLQISLEDVQSHTYSAFTHGNPSNTMLWKARVSRVRRIKNDGVGQRYGPCENRDHCLDFPRLGTLPAGPDVEIGTIALGYDAFASDIGFHCSGSMLSENSEKASETESHGESESRTPVLFSQPGVVWKGGYESSIQLNEQEYVQESTKNVTDVHNLMHNQNCVRLYFLFNTPATATFEVQRSTLTGPLGRNERIVEEGDTIFICQQKNTCIPELLNLAIHVPRVRIK